ncbi:hypothetical protein C8J57DRAFT_1713404, partial [Mycena rebaudengoi]
KLLLVHIQAACNVSCWLLLNFTLVFRPAQLFARVAAFAPTAESANLKNQCCRSFLVCDPGSLFARSQRDSGSCCGGIFDSRIRVSGPAGSRRGSVGSEA